MNLRLIWPFDALLSFYQNCRNSNYGFSVLNLGKSATTCSTQLTTYNEGEKLISYLHDSPQMKEKQVSNWEANLEDVLIQLRNQIEKERITHSTPDKLFILYTICRLVFDVN